MAGAPGGIVMEACPPKVSARSDPCSIAAPLLDTAKCAAPITKGLVPYSFDSTTRTRLPPMLTAAIWRMV